MTKETDLTEKVGVVNGVSDTPNTHERDWRHGRGAAWSFWSHGPRRNGIIVEFRPRVARMQPAEPGCNRRGWLVLLFRGKLAFVAVAREPYRATLLSSSTRWLNK